MQETLPQEMRGAYATLLKNWLSVSESQICALEVLSDQLPKVNTLLTTNMTGISDEFLVIADKLQKQQNLITSLLAQDGENPALQALKELSTHLTRHLEHVIVGMQFQDRVSQNLVIVINVLQSIISHSRTTIDGTLGALESSKESILLDIDFTKQLITFLNLGELQKAFVDHLITHGYINAATDLGIEEHVPESGDGDIELF